MNQGLKAQPLHRTCYGTSKSDKKPCELKVPSLCWNQRDSRQRVVTISIQCITTYVSETFFICAPQKWRLPRQLWDTCRGPSQIRQGQVGDRSTVALGGVRRRTQQALHPRLAVRMIGKMQSFMQAQHGFAAMCHGKVAEGAIKACSPRRQPTNPQAMAKAQTIALRSCVPSPPARQRPLIQQREWEPSRHSWAPHHATLRVHSNLGQSGRSQGTNGRDWPFLSLHPP